jgi:hypothetical protein
MTNTNTIEFPTTSNLISLPMAESASPAIPDHRGFGTEVLRAAAFSLALGAALLSVGAVNAAALRVTANNGLQLPEDASLTQPAMIVQPAASADELQPSQATADYQQTVSGQLLQGSGHKLTLVSD